MFTKPFFYLTDDNRAPENDFFGKVDPSGSYLKNQPNNSDFFKLFF